MVAERSWQLPSSQASCNATSQVDVAVAGWFATLRLWQERGRQRRALARVEDALLRDVGLTREEAARECAKPVWRA